MMYGQNKDIIKIVTDFQTNYAESDNFFKISIKFAEYSFELP